MRPTTLSSEHVIYRNGGCYYAVLHPVEPHKNNRLHPTATALSAYNHGTSYCSYLEADVRLSLGPGDLPRAWTVRLFLLLPSRPLFCVEFLAFVVGLQAALAPAVGGGQLGGGGVAGELGARVGGARCGVSVASSCVAIFL
jgi:hypothetical protein